MAQQIGSNIAILAGGGHLPVEVAHAARARGHHVLVVGIAQEADLADLDPNVTQKNVGWGQFGTLQRHLKDHGTEKLVIIGSIQRRPEVRDVKLDWGTLQLLPQLLTVLLAGGDASVLDKVAKLFADLGFNLVGAHEVAPSLLAEEGHLAGPKLTETGRQDASKAMRAAWTAGHLDMGQGAVAVGGRIVAIEGAEGTDGLLARVASMRRDKRFSAQGRVGALAKCTRPRQDLRLDMPAIGPRTIENAAEAGLAAVAVEAGRVLVTQRHETLAQCKAHKISLVAHPRAAFVPDDREDEPA
jgi:DUF1009 family protein